MLKIFLLLTVLGTKIIYAQFLEQPPAGNVFAPVNDRVTLSCSVDVGYGIDWEVKINNGEPIFAARRIHEVAFMRHNFTFTGVATSTSTISFGILNETGSQTNNVTTITCIAQLGVTARQSGNEVQVIYYGAPLPPTDLNVTEDELGSLNISWSLGFIEGVPVNYTLTVLNLNTTNSQPIMTSELLDQYYVFETSRPCDAYSFTVIAVTAAGNSTPSQELIFSRNSNDKCLDASTPVPTTDATTTINGNAGLSGGEIAGIVIGIIVAVVIGFFITIIVVLTCPFLPPKDIIYTSTPHKITVSWKHRLCIRHCNMKIDENGDIIRVTKNTFTFHHLQPGTTYQIHVAGANRIVCGPFAVMEATTKTTSHSNVLTADVGRLQEMKHQFDDPRGLTSSHGKVLVVEAGKQGISVFKNSCLTRFMRVGKKDLSEIIVHEETGYIYVTSGASHEVLKLNSEGKTIRVSTKSLELANGLCIDKNEKLHVCDTKAGKIEVFDLDLKHIKTLTGEEDGGKPFQRPRDVEMDENSIYIAEKNGIRVLTPDGGFKHMIGENDLSGVSGLKIVDNSIFVASREGISLICPDQTHCQNLYESVAYDHDPSGITVDNGYVYFSSSKGKCLYFKTSSVAHNTN